MYHVICSFIPANLVSAVTKGFNTCNTEFFRILGWGCLSLNIDVNCRLSLEGVARLGRGCAHGSSSRDPSDKLWDVSERRGPPVRWTCLGTTLLMSDTGDMSWDTGRVLMSLSKEPSDSDLWEGKVPEFLWWVTVLVMTPTEAGGCLEEVPAVITALSCIGDKAGARRL